MPLRLAIVACASIPFLASLHTYPIPTFYAEFATGVCWIALAVAVLALTWSSQTGLPRIALAPLALISVLFVQLQAAPPLNPFLSLVAAVFLLAAAAVCGLGARCRNLPGVLEALAIGLILGGLLTVAIELLQAFRVEELSPTFISMSPTGPDRRMWGNLNQPNHVASYLAFGLAACAFLASKYRRIRTPLVVVAVALLVGMSLTFSRISWLHLVAVGGLAGIAWTHSQRGWRRWAMACVPTLVLALTYQCLNELVSYANLLWHLDLPGSLGERLKEGTGSRMLLWKHAWRMFLMHPWLGGGWGDYAWNQYVQIDTVGPAVLSLHAHNIVLDLLAKVGVVGLLAVALPFAGLARVVWRNRVTPEHVLLYGVILVMVAHSMLEYPLHYLYFLLPFAFALGYVDDCILRVPSAAMTKGLAAMVLIGNVVLLGHLWRDYDAVERLIYAPDQVFAQELERYRRQGGTLLSPFGTQAEAMRWNVVPIMAPALELLERQAAEFLPNTNVVQRYALALAYLRKTDEAVTQVRRMHNTLQQYEVTRMHLLEDACKLKDQTDALRLFCSRLKAEGLLSGVD